jgi:hypothetical protein
MRLTEPNETIMLTATELHAFIDGYKQCALWSTTASGDDLPESDQSFTDLGYGIDDLDEEAAGQMERDCIDFIDANLTDLNEFVQRTRCGWRAAGGDLWLTRNRHGTGYWDRDAGEIGQRLTDAAHAHDETSLVLLGGKVCT